MVAALMLGLLQPGTPPALAAGEAEQYAKSVLKGCRLIEEEHYLAPSQARLLGDGVRGLHERLRLPIPADIQKGLLLLKWMDDSERELLIADMRRRLGKRPELADGRDLALLLDESARRLDRFSGAAIRDIVCVLGRQYEGTVGVKLRRSLFTGLLVVVTPLRGSQAEAAGLRSGDVVVAVTSSMSRDGELLDKEETLSTRDLSCEWPRDFRRGNLGTTMRWTVRREGEKRPLEIEIVRDGTRLETVHGRKRTKEGDWDHWLDPEKKIAYVRISQFSVTTGGEMQTIVRRLRKAGMKALVLDLRGNPGGLLVATSEVAGLFLKEGVVATVRTRQGKTQRWDVEQTKVRFDGPLCVLQNEESASASEILSACLQDHRRAAVAGTRSFGRAGVQSVTRFGSCDLMLSTAEFQRPSGKSIQGWHAGEGGVATDKGLEVRLSREEREALRHRILKSEILPWPDRPASDPFAKFKDAQLDKALAWLRGKLG